MAFFLLYGFVLHPFQEALTPHQSADALASFLGENRQHWVSVYRYWMNSLFFVCAELWGGLAIGMLFWGFANELSQVADARKYYASYSAFGHIATLLTGPVLVFFTQYLAPNDFTLSIRYLMLLCASICIILMAIIHWCERNVLTDSRLYTKEQQQRLKKEKPKLSLFQSLRYLCKSKYLGFLAILVLSYGLAFNMIEVTWKANIKLLYPNPSDYQSFMGVVTSAIGFTALASTIFASITLRYFSWRCTALVTPLIVGITGISFFLAFTEQDLLSSFTTMLGITPLALVVFLGAAQNSLTKAAKYTFFDTSKEIAYIPLDAESKVKGKAAIDVVAARLGKSGSSWIQIILIDVAGAGSVLGITHLLFPFVIITLAMWIYSVFRLGTLFSETQKENSQEEIISEANPLIQKASA